MVGCGCVGEVMCFACKTRYWRENNALQISPAATPTRRNSKPSTMSVPMNSWERGVARDNRGMPLLNSDLSPIGVKEYGERRSELDEAKRRIRNTPAPSPSQ